MNLKKTFRKNEGFIILLITALLFLLFPAMIRTLFYKNIPGGTTNYKDIILASRVSSAKHNYESTVPKIVSPYYLFLNFMLKFLNPNFLMNFLPPLFGLLFIIFFYLILKKIGVERESLFITILMIILSASFIYNFTILNENSFSLVFIALGLLLFLTENKITSLLGILILILISFSSFVACVVSYLLLMLFIMYKSQTLAYKIEKKKMVIFTISLVFVVLILLNIHSTKLAIFGDNRTFLSYFSEITMTDGFGIILLILSLIGILTLPNERRMLKNIFAVTILLLIIFGSNFIVYANIIFCISAAYGFLWIIKRKWELRNLNIWSFLLIICGIFFVAISVDLNIANQRPNLEDIEALNALKNCGDGIVLSHPDYGFWIDYFSEKNALTNNLNFEPFKDEISKLFQSYNLSLSLEIIEKNIIKYIFITPEMKSGLIWNEEDEGLLFIMKNSNRFKKIYSKNNYEIWEVLNEQN